MILCSARNGMRRFCISVCIAVLACGLVSAKPKQKSELVKEEDGFYYGYGKAESTAEAITQAKKDLVEKALTATVRMSDPASKAVTVADDVVDVRLGNMKPFFQSKDGKNVTYRVKVADWEKSEKAYMAKIRESLNPEYNKFLSSRKMGDKFELATKILSTLQKNGLTNILTYQESGTELLSRKIENVCKNTVEGFDISFSQKDCLLKLDSPLTITVKDRAGNNLSDMKLKTVWAVPYVEVLAENSEVGEVVSFVKTDADGNATIDFPLDDEYKNTVLTLTITTSFGTADFVSPQMRAIDNASAVEARYYCPSDINQTYSFINVEAGPFVAGALNSDIKAARKEAAREVELGAFDIATAPVTNFQYALYVWLTRNEEGPEYLLNPDYNGPEQPIIGVSAKDAEDYAAWLSSQIGATLRLPTDDEWEKAARAGNEFIYPWGDDDPSKAKKANYKGNGKYKYTSPVGAFESGVNAWGLVDMSGNVWEWTSSMRNLAEDSEMRTVKGGSWMDGPNDLRISNYKNIDATKGYPDVGIRLVKEVSK